MALDVVILWCLLWALVFVVVVVFLLWVFFCRFFSLLCFLVCCFCCPFCFLWSLLLCFSSSVGFVSPCFSFVGVSDVVCSSWLGLLCLRCVLLVGLLLLWWCCFCWLCLVFFSYALRFHLCSVAGKYLFCSWLGK